MARRSPLSHPVAPPPAPGDDLEAPAGSAQGLARAMWRARALALLRWGLVAVFIGAGAAKLLSMASMVALFDLVGLGQWFRYAVGTYELVGAALLAYAATEAIGAAALIALMVGAAATEILILHRLPFSSGVTLAGLVVVAWQAVRGTGSG